MATEVSVRRQAAGHARCNASVWVHARVLLDIRVHFECGRVAAPPIVALRGTVRAGRARRLITLHTFGKRLKTATPPRPALHE